VVQIGPTPAGLAVGDGAIWVGDEDGVIRRVDEDTRQVTEIRSGAKIRGLAFDEETGHLRVDVA
jgi:streptogramin lyase